MVPKNLRVGPWSKTAVPTILLLVFAVAYHTPFEDQFDIHVESYPPAFSNYWWYNILGFILMLAVLARCLSAAHVGILGSFTLMSWNMNALRHGCNALIPFLSDEHVVLKVNHVLRFPALLSATITFVIWNFALAPYFYFKVMPTKEKKDGFAVWNTRFNMIQFHVCNMFYSVLNTVVTGSNRNGSPPLFDKEDLWYAFAYGLSYALFYVLVMDRLGLHLYPIFSPRLKYFVVAWGAAASLFGGVYLFWNHLIAEHFSTAFKFHYLLCYNFIAVGIGAAVKNIMQRRFKEHKVTEEKIDTKE